VGMSLPQHLCKHAFSRHDSKQRSEYPPAPPGERQWPSSLGLSWGWLPHNVYANTPCAGMELAAGISARLTLPATSAYLSPIYCANAVPVCCPTRLQGGRPRLTTCRAPPTLANCMKMVPGGPDVAELCGHDGGHAHTLIRPQGQADRPTLYRLYFKPSIRQTHPGLVSATSQKAYTRR
jgi:hypothetical protein